MSIDVAAFFDQPTYTISYVVTDKASGRAAIVDSVLGYDPDSGCTDDAPAERIADYVREKGLTVDWLLETHVHADHLSGGPWLRERLGGRIAISHNVTQVQETFSRLFGLTGFHCDGRQFDRLLADDEQLPLGDATIRALPTPGHTPACMTYVIDGVAFVGDTLFMPDFGSARTDFPGGDARTLYRSIRRILALPPETTLYMCHDYKAPGRDEYAWETTVAEQRKRNVHIHDGVSEADYVAFREGRDAELSVPRLLLPAVQVNIRAGQLPEAEPNGTSYLKIPLNAL